MAVDKHLISVYADMLMAFGWTSDTDVARHTFSLDLEYQMHMLHTE
jgi:hypothetical protein